MTPRAIATATTLAILITAAAAGATPPVGEDYILHCSGCHRLDGGGVKGTIPSLHNLAPLLTKPGGRDYLARVPGVAQAPLDDARLARLLNWVVREFSGAEVTPPYAAAEVGRLRAKPLRDAPAARP